MFSGGIHLYGVAMPPLTPHAVSTLFILGFLLEEKVAHNSPLGGSLILVESANVVDVFEGDHLANELHNHSYYDHDVPIV